MLMLIVRHSISNSDGSPPLCRSSPMEEKAQTVKQNEEEEEQQQSQQPQLQENLQQMDNPKSSPQHTKSPTTTSINTYMSEEETHTPNAESPMTTATKTSQNMSSNSTIPPSKTNESIPASNVVDKISNTPETATTPTTNISTIDLVDEPKDEVEEDGAAAASIAV